jgi:phosphoribosylformylglycinamidine cyclo-ligase
MLSYKEAGVDVDKNDELVIDIRKISDISTGFAAAFPLPSPTFIAKTGTIVQPHLVQCSDGVGTKVQIAHHYGIMEGIGQDLVAMCVNDLYCLGAKPMFFQDYIGMNNLDKRTIGIVIQSIQNACEMCDTKLTGGEMAELPGTYIHDAPELVGFATGFVFPEQMITGKTIKPGDVVMGFESSGVHSNGFSLVRKILDNMYNISDDFIRMLLKPTTIYTKVIEEHYNPQ